MNTMYRLLIADDALDELECIVFLISKFKLPFEVTSAINGEDALGYLQQEHFDILLTDIQMPFMDGLELSKHALALYPDLRVVIISAHEDFSYAQTAIRLGVCEYLLKPIQPQELNNILQKVLSSIKEQHLQKRLDSMTANYAKNHLLLQLIQGSTLTDEHSKLLVKTYFSDFNAMALLESRQDLFDSIQTESYINSICNFNFYFLTLTPSLGLLLLNERTLPSSFNLDMLLEQLSNMLHCASLISLKISYGFLSDSADIPAIYKKLEELLENAFLFPNRTIFSLNLYNEMKKAQEIPSSIFSSASGKIREVKHYIYDHYGSELSLDLLSSIIFVHPDYLSRLFKKETGCNLNQFIKQYRMEKAKELLTDTQMKISAMEQKLAIQTALIFVKPLMTISEYHRKNSVRKKVSNEFLKFYIF